jgi:hypothetical protein
MKEIRSKINNELLHIVFKKEDFVKERIDITSEDKFLQVAAMKLGNGRTFQPHRHIPLKRESSITQESWVIISGKIKATYYDMDDSIICEEMLEQGDCTITLYGGHNYTSLEDGSLIYEMKLGPYLGREADKVAIQ